MVAEGAMVDLSLTASERCVENVSLNWLLRNGRPRGARSTAGAA